MISLNFAYFFKLTNVLLGVGIPHGCMGILPGERGLDTGVGRLSNPYYDDLK